MMLIVMGFQQKTIVMTMTARPQQSTKMRIVMDSMMNMLSSFQLDIITAVGLIAVVLFSVGDRIVMVK